jgi:hypothetical protein
MSLFKKLFIDEKIKIDLSEVLFLSFFPTKVELFVPCKKPNFIYGRFCF